MILPINDDWRIASDSYCWMVQRRRIRTDKEMGERVDAWESVSYHPTAVAAMEGAGERFLRLDPAEGAVEALRAVTRLSTALSGPIEQMHEAIRRGPR